MSTAEFVSLLIACLIGLIIVDRIIRRFLEGKKQPVSKPELPVEAAQAFAQAVHLAAKPILTEQDEAELARCLQNTHTMLH